MLKANIDRDDLDVTADTVLVLRNAGPLGGPGMPEWGMLAHSEETGETGRARHGPHFRRKNERNELMAPASCTSRPESFIGGPLALVKTGDLISGRRARPHA